jgi:hypothetical protein
MYHLSLCFILPMINAFVTVKIICNSFYQANSSCAFLGNYTLANDASIQTCIWKCVDVDDCQTAVFFNDGRICSMFSEFYERGIIEPSGDVRASVLCYRKSYSKSLCLIQYDRTDRCFQR